MTRAASLSLAVVAALTACGTEPVYTAFEVSLISPHSLEGAAVIELDGEFANATTGGDGQVYTHADNGITRVVIVLEDPGVIEFTLQTDAAREVPTARVIEVADASNELRSSLGEYRVEFRGVSQ
jgi:hypothetical protein